MLAPQPVVQTIAMPSSMVFLVPRATPYFPGGEASPENGIRGYYQECCCGMRPGTGPNVPLHWFDGGNGWATAHFFDVQPFDMQLQVPGVHQCKYCNYVAEGEDCCCKGCCWCPLGRAPGKMVSHLITSHMIAPPPKRDWATGCCDTQGCCDAICCFPCQASRQINASHGLANQCNPFWCMYFMFAFQSHKNQDGETISSFGYCLAAYMTRNAIKTLNRIDEGCCKTFMMSFCCPACSIAQTYREFSAAGVWPGGVCAGDAPPVIMMNNPPPSIFAAESAAIASQPIPQPGSPYGNGKPVV